LNPLYEEIADALAEQGYFVSDALFPIEFCRKLRNELEKHYEEGEFRAAGIGRGADFKLRPEIRSDKVLWIDEDKLSGFQQAYWARVDELRSYLNRALFLPINSFEAHYAVYPVGSFYKTHLDMHASAKQRLLSCILYLNEDWQLEHEGYLRLYDQHYEHLRDVEPKMGNFVIFRSGDIPHEVLPTKVPRYSITGWMRNDTLSF
jgi:SM-20-related protein